MATTGLVNIQFTGMKEMLSFLNTWEDNLSKVLSQGNKEFMEKVKEDAKFFAPVDTGELRDSIEVYPVKTTGAVNQWKLVVGARHGLFQEYGFKPHPVQIMNSSKFDTPFWTTVSKWTPFLRPAIDKNLRILTSEINQNITKVLRDK